MTRADGQDHTSAVGELRNQGFGNSWSACGNHDLVKRRMLRQAATAITMDNVNVLVSEPRENFARFVRQLCLTLDGPDLGR